MSDNLHFFEKAFYIFLNTYNSSLDETERARISLIETKNLENFSFSPKLDKFRNYGDFVVKTLHIKKYPNITVDVRIKPFSPEKQNVFRLTFVYPSMEKELLIENQILVDIEEEKLLFNWDEKITHLKKQFEELVSGARPLNTIDLGTYNIINIGKYSPGRTDRKISILEYVTTEFLNYRKTDLIYSYNNIFTFITNEPDPDKRKEFLKYVGIQIEKMTALFISSIFNEVFNDFIDVREQTINISVPPFIKSDLSRFKKYLVNFNIENEPLSKLHKYIDKYLSHKFMHSTYLALKKMFNIHKALYIISLDVPYFSFDYDIKKCYETVYYQYRESGNYRCFKRQMFDILTMLLNEKVEKLINDEFNSNAAPDEQDYHFSKYSLKNIQYDERTPSLSQVSSIYYYLKNISQESFFGGDVYG